ncbi:MAG: hypothetical protein SFY92_08595 [Verrucomicrobiae bacterium]|nr:hypothetical protein [Verrucomicrobiae bacterium]
MKKHLLILVTILCALSLGLTHVNAGNCGGCSKKKSESTQKDGKTSKDAESKEKDSKEKSADNKS